MFQTLLAFYIILIIAMIVCIRIVSKGTIKDRKSIVRLICMGVFTMGFYVIFILIPPSQRHLAAFMGGLYYLATDWLAIYLMFFAAAYTQIQPPSRLPRRIIGALAGVDSISYLINTFTRHMFDLDIAVEERMGVEYWNLHFTTVHIIHLLFVYLIVIYSVSILAYRFFTVPTIYKNKYGSILLQALIVIILNMVCTILGTKFDYSVILYGFLAMSISYFVLYASPKKVLESIHSTIVGESVIGLFAYDDQGNCIGANQVAKEMFGQQGEIKSVAEQYLKDWEEEHQGSMTNVMGAERTITKNGEKIYIYVNYQKLSDKKGRVLGSSFQFEERSGVVKRIKEEQYRATHDVLTGLLNRTAFEEEAKKILAEAKEPYCMICSNIQDFKLVNELYGSETGDALLIAEADRIRESAIENSVSARIYADKFCTLMPKRYYDEQRFTEHMADVMERGLKDMMIFHYHLGVYDIVDVTEPVWTMYDKAMVAIESLRGNYGQYVS